MLSHCTLLLGQAEGLAGRQEQAHELQQSKTFHNVVLMPALLLSITENLDRQSDASGREQESSTEKACKLTLRCFIHRCGNAHISTA